MSSAGSQPGDGPCRCPPVGSLWGCPCAVWRSSTEEGPCRGRGGGRDRTAGSPRGCPCAAWGSSPGPLAGHRPCRGPPAGSQPGCPRGSRQPRSPPLLTPQGPRAGCERGPRCRCRPPRRAARSMPLSPAGSKHESPESPPPEPPPPPERQPRAAAAGEPGAGLREETRLDPARGPGGPRSPKLAAPARMEEPAPGAIVVRIGIPDLQQTVSARPGPGPSPAPRQLPPPYHSANFAPPRAGGVRPRARQDGSPLPWLPGAPASHCPGTPLPPSPLRWCPGTPLSPSPLRWCPGSPLPRSLLPRLPSSPQSPAGTRVERAGQPRLRRYLPGAQPGRGAPGPPVRPQPRAAPRRPGPAPVRDQAALRRLPRVRGTAGLGVGSGQRSGGSSTGMVPVPVLHRHRGRLRHRYRLGWAAGTRSCSAVLGTDSRLLAGGVGGQDRAGCAWAVRGCRGDLSGFQVSGLGATQQVAVSAWCTTAPDGSMARCGVPGRGARSAGGTRRCDLPGAEV